VDEFADTMILFGRIDIDQDKLAALVSPFDEASIRAS